MSSKAAAPKRRCAMSAATARCRPSASPCSTRRRAASPTFWNRSCWMPPPAAGLDHHQVFGEVLQRDDPDNPVVVVDDTDQRLAAALKLRQGLAEGGPTIDGRHVSLHDIDHRRVGTALGERSDHVLPGQDASQPPETVGYRELALRR